MITRRENGPLLATLVCFVLSVFSGYGPPLSIVQSWHLEWAWRMYPGVRRRHRHCHRWHFHYPP